MSIREHVIALWARLADKTTAQPLPGDAQAMVTAACKLGLTVQWTWTTEKPVPGAPGRVTRLYFLVNAQMAGYVECDASASEALDMLEQWYADGFRLLEEKEELARRELVDLYSGGACVVHGAPIGASVPE